MSKSILPLIFFICVSVVASIAQQQCDDLDVTSIDEVSESVQSQLLEKGERKIQIYLIRHAKPNLQKQFLSSSKGCN